MLKPLNDYALVELIDEASASGLEIAHGEYDGAEKGRVIEIGAFGYLSTNAWVMPLFSTKIDGTGVNERFVYQEQFKTLVGKIIYWEKFTDNNATVDYDGKKYAFIKLTKITGYAE
jgi:co-chaperonin GroES (HSP10)